MLVFWHLGDLDIRIPGHSHTWTFAYLDIRILVPLNVRHDIVFPRLGRMLNTGSLWVLFNIDENATNSVPRNVRHVIVNLILFSCPKPKHALLFESTSVLCAVMRSHAQWTSFFHNA